MKQLYNKIIGKHICLRPVSIRDAAFILSLRLDQELGKYISATETDIGKQEKWIADSLTRTNEHYFIIEGRSGEPYGTVRIYDIAGDRFTWGSWIIKREAPIYTAIESVLLVYDMAFMNLGLKKACFCVRKENTKVLRFHKEFGAQIVGEDDQDCTFEMSRENYDMTRQKYAKYVDDGHGSRTDHVY